MGQLEFDYLTDEISGDEQEGDDTMDDVDCGDFGAGEEEVEPHIYDIDMEQILFAYLPCCAHNFQLVLKDGFKLDRGHQLSDPRCQIAIFNGVTQNILFKLLKKISECKNQQISTRQFPSGLRNFRFLFSPGCCWSFVQTLFIDRLCSMICAPRLKRSSPSMS